MRAAADVGSRTRRRPSSRPAESASSSYASASRAATRDPRRFITRCSASSRSTPTSGSSRVVSFDLDDFDAAFAELDARYLAGEAAAHAHTWSVIAGAYAAINRHELPATTPDWVNIDHRAESAFAPGDLIAYIRAAWDARPDTQDLHRGCASAERSRSGRHPCGAWDLARRLRRRVAGSRPLDGRWRPDQPLRGLRRGRPRRRDREVR